MFALVLKNSILMLLIIFIIHFMILNYAKEFTPTSINVAMSSFTDSVMSLNKTEILENKSELNNTKTSYDKTELDIIHENSDDALMDLYNFVYNEDETADISQLDSYFPNDSFLKSNHTDVPCSKQPNEGSSKQFCLSEVDAFFKKNMKTKIVSSEDKNQSTSSGNHPIIHEYKEFNNDDLIGYETYESSFMKF